MKNLGERERGRIQGLPKFLEYPPVISGTGKAANFKFCTRIHRIDRNKSPKRILNFGKSSSRRSQGIPRIFRAPIYRAHRTVIFATVQLSCMSLCFIQHVFRTVKRANIIDAQFVKTVFPDTISPHNLCAKVRYFYTFALHFSRFIIGEIIIVVVVVLVILFLVVIVIIM